MSYLRPSLLILLLLTLLTGVVYPLLTTGLAQLLFPQQANGSRITSDSGTVVGSALIGQAFSQPGYFWGRPSATADNEYNALASGGSNLSVDNPQLVETIAQRAAALRQAQPTPLLPSALLSASASGLDPHIPVEAARYQVSRIAKARHLSEEQVSAVVEQLTESPFPAFIGPAVVNVLKLNLALDSLPPAQDNGS